MLKFIQTLDHTDSSHYRNENQLAVWVILEIFDICIKIIKGWFKHPQICWQEFVK